MTRASSALGSVSAFSTGLGFSVAQCAPGFNQTPSKVARRAPVSVLGLDQITGKILSKIGT